MNVTVSGAQPTDRDALAQLLELNAYEFSRLDGRAVGRDAGSGTDLVRSGDGLLQIAEFLVLPKFRRAGVGTLAARRVFDRHQGEWSVDQLSENVPATSFWRQAIPVSFEEWADENGRVVQRFSM